MNYAGGKTRQAKEFVTALLAMNEEGLDIYIPFVGGGSIVEELAKRTRLPIACSDVFPELIEMWVRLVYGKWRPPTSISRERWKECRDGKNCPGYERAYVGFAASFCGRFFSSYAKPTKRVDFVELCARRTEEKATAMWDAEVDFFVEDFTAHVPSGQRKFIYCDPPYAGEDRDYPHLPKFDREAFWSKVRELSLFYQTPVVVSEYAAPEDFVRVYSKVQVTTMGKGRSRRRIESLWVCRHGPLAKWAGKLQSREEVEQIEQQGGAPGEPWHASRILGKIGCSAAAKESIRREIERLQRSSDRQASFKTFMEAAALEISDEQLPEALRAAEEDGPVEENMVGFFDRGSWDKIRGRAATSGCSIRTLVLGASLLKARRDMSCVTLKV